jgi:hypothetical protein
MQIKEWYSVDNHGGVTHLNISFDERSMKEQISKNGHIVVVRLYQVAYRSDSSRRILMLRIGAFTRPLLC